MLKSANHIAAMGLAALGVVFGDIGTSPLYTLKTVLDVSADSSQGAVLGVLSLVLYTLDHRYQHQIRHHRHAR
jgi:KUP system potassium uptake protein